MPVTSPKPNRISTTLSILTIIGHPERAGTIQPTHNQGRWVKRTHRRLVIVDFENLKPGRRRHSGDLQRARFVVVAEHGNNPWGCSIRLNKADLKKRAGHISFADRLKSHFGRRIDE